MNCRDNGFNNVLIWFKGLIGCWTNRVRVRVVRGGGNGSRGGGNGSRSRPSFTNFRQSVPSTPIFFDQSKENTYRRRLVSSSLFYPLTADPMSNKVAWLSNSIDGPYEGKLGGLTKCSFQLLNNLSSGFYVFYASLCSFLTGCGFNDELLPDIQFVT